MLQDVSLEQAQKSIVEGINALPAELVDLQAALGRVLAQDLAAPNNLPIKAQSAVDGFALGDDSKAMHSTFVIQGYSDLGDFPQHALQPGQARGVLTGGILPEGTKAVIPNEMTKVVKDILTALEVIKPYNNIKHAGEDFASGEMLLAKGTRIDPGSIALLAAFGITLIPVHQKPRVTVLGLGINIVPCQQKPQPGQVRDSNGPMLAALINQAGGLTAACEVCTGKEDAQVSKKISELLQISNVLIITGGTYTLGNQTVLQQVGVMGGETLFQGVQMMPGSHTGAVRLDGQLILTLSGNPAACAVGYHLYATPVLRALQGINPSGHNMNAICINGFDKKSGSRRFIRACASCTSQGWEATVLPGQKPSMLRSMLKCNALIDVPAGSQAIAPGEQVSILLLG